MLINLKALSEAKIFKKKKNSGARATSRTTHNISTPQSRYIVNIAILLGLIEGALLYTLLIRPLLQK